MDDQSARLLFHKYLAGECSPAEVDQLFDFMNDPGQEAVVKGWITSQFGQSAIGQPFVNQPSERPSEAYADVYSDVFARIQSEIALNRVAKVRRLAPRWIKFTAAAAVVILLAGGWRLWLKQPNPEKPGATPVTQLSQDALPGHNGAILTLSDGSRKVLDSAADGLVAQQGASDLMVHKGQLSYTVKSSPETRVVYNTVTTPRGRQFQLVLPDGTTVWLNAASSIKYPTAFTGTTRPVEITGEAYLEVAKNAAQPFYVHIAGKEDIEVLGTSFNVNAYADEGAIATTLVEGSIKVTVPGGAAGQNKLLRPGQQASVSLAGIQVSGSVELDQVLAWKNGAFAFRDADLSTVMRQLGRWYDVQVEYPNGIPAGHFSGEIGRNLTLSQVLCVLTKTSIKYKIENGSKIYVLPN